MFGGLRFSVWRIWGSEVLGFEDFEVLRAFGRTPSCSTSLPGGNQVDGLPPGVHQPFQFSKCDLSCEMIVNYVSRPPELH